MNLKLKRLVRTNTSEQYALYDLDQSDSDDQPLIIGKVDLHYTGEGVYGTLLLWDASTRRLSSAQRRAFVNAILGEITQPMGVPNEFVVEFFMPSLDDYELFHNVGAEEEELDDLTEDGLEEDGLEEDEIEEDELDEDDLDDSLDGPLDEQESDGEDVDAAAAAPATDGNTRDAISGDDTPRRTQRSTRPYQK